jgi:hypothetical protein
LDDVWIVRKKTKVLHCAPLFQQFLEIPMQFTEEHNALRQTVANFVDKELNPHADEWEKAGIFPAGNTGFFHCGNAVLT